MRCNTKVTSNLASVDRGFAFLRQGSCRISIIYTCISSSADCRHVHVVILSSSSYRHTYTHTYTQSKTEYQIKTGSTHSQLSVLSALSALSALSDADRTILTDDVTDIREQIRVPRLVLVLRQHFYIVPFCRLPLPDDYDHGSGVTYSP